MNNTINFNMADRVARYTEDKCDNKVCVTTELPAEPVVAMAYIPFQLDKTSYTAEKALQEGTLFPVLNKPFRGRSLCHE